ncbi:MAG TPA: hypothetical protein VIM59_02405 [Cellvibrio sp.]
MKNIIACKIAAKSINYYWVIFMLSIITSIFSNSAHAGKKDQTFPRQVNLSGNIFHFSMPEDFSKDMPAADMVENLDINDLNKFNDPQYGNLIRRWWDIKEPGWFGKKLGSVMMDISVQRTAENKAKLFHAKPYNIEDRMDFMLMLDDVFHQRYDELNKTLEAEPGRTKAYHSGFVSMSGRKILSLQNEHVSNNQKWLKQAIAGPKSTIIVNYATLINPNIYIMASFTYSPNYSISSRQLLEVADLKMKAVEQSFDIQYAKNNSVENIVGSYWLTITNDEVMDAHRDVVQNLLYGPDAEKILLRQEKDLKEFKLKDEAEMRETLKNDPL